MRRVSIHTTRRKFLGRTAVVGAGATAWATVGCGDDSDGDDASIIATPTTAAGATATPTPADPFATAKRGGIFKGDWTGDPPTIDPYGNTGFLTKTFAAYVYSRLFKYQTGPGIASGDVRPTGDLAETAEASPDGLTWTITLRPNARFHNVAPVNGRDVTSDDLKFSWGRATATSNPNYSQLSFVDKVEYPNARTAVFKLKSPNAAFLDVLADANLFWVMPTESDGGFNPAITAIGSGPWLFDSYTVSSSLKFKRNPDWYMDGFPLMDGVEIAIIPEYANRIAQFRAGNTHGTGVSAADLVSIKQGIQGVTLEGNLSEQTSYVYFDSDPAAPWRDERVRQAVSMSLDRDGMNDLAFEVNKLRSAGIDIQSLWNNIIPAGMTRYWLDPQSSAHGETGKFFKYDPAEAKKLLSAAGFANGFPVKFQYAGNRYGSDFNALAETKIAFLGDIGLNVTTDVQDYNSVYITQTSVGNFSGIAFGPETPFPEAGSYALRLFTDNPKNRGKVRDAELDRISQAQQSELDPEKRRELFFELQKYQASKMYYIPSQYRAGTNWTAYQAKVKNADNYRTKGYAAPTESMVYRWLDQ